MSYHIHFPRSGGKAGKGRNKTSSIQVRYHGAIIKLFRYDVTNGFSEAHEKAKAFVAMRIAHRKFIEARNTLAKRS